MNIVLPSKSEPLQVTTNLEIAAMESLIKPTDREKLLAKLESFKIATAKTNLTAREKEELDKVAKKFVPKSPSESDRLIELEI